MNCWSLAISTADSGTSRTDTWRPQLPRSFRFVEAPVASEAIPAAVRQFQSEIDAIRHEDEPLSVRTTVLVFGAACLVLALILTFARVDRVVSSTGGKI